MNIHVSPEPGVRLSPIALDVNTNDMNIHVSPEPGVILSPLP